jgi:hypothetical protein
MALYARVPLPFLLRFPEASAAPGDDRRQDVSCRFGADYPRVSVAYQRQQIRRRMADRIGTDKLSRRQYFAELRASQSRGFTIRLWRDYAEGFRGVSHGGIAA